MAYSKLYHHSQHYEVLELQGNKATNLLQNILSSDVSALVSNTWQFSALCSHQGRVLSLFKLLKVSSTRYLIQLPQSVGSLIKTELQKYAQFSGVELLNLTKKLNQLIIFDAKPIKNSLHFKNLADTFNIQIVLLEKSQNLVEFIANQLADFELIKIASYKNILIDYKIAEIELPCSGLFVAQMINLENIGGLSFTKGCYIGQEVIARLHYKGRLTRRIKTILLTPEIQKNNNLSIGSTITNNKGNKIGVLVQKSQSQLQLVSKI